ncbi:MAG: ABC-2 family transporter protein [Opitutaceae bacterium]|jgi:ABC-2 type transport system permease protein
MTLAHYLRIWLASARYSIVRTMMFRFDFLMWSLVEFLWMSVNVLLVAVIYRHTDSIAGWNKYEMLLLVGTAMILQRLMMGLFWSNLFELGRNIRTGNFDFFLCQPGNPIFMVSTRKLDPDGLINTFVAIGVVIYSAQQLGLHPGLLNIALYIVVLLIALIIHYSALLLIVSSTFWIIGSQGIEGSYFNLFEFSRLPKEAYKGFVSLIVVYALPAVVASNVPARVLIHGFQPLHVFWLGGLAALWFAVAVFCFNRGLRRYSSASS